MFILNFLKSLVIPKRMVKFASMSLFFSIAIFILGSYVLAYPQMQLISKNRYRIIEEQNAYRLQIFNHLDEAQVEQLRSTGFEFSRKGLFTSEELVEGEPFIFTINQDSKVSKIYVVFDLYDPFDKEEEPQFDIKEQYLDIEKEENIDYYLLVFYQNQVIYLNPDNSIKLPLEYKVDVPLNFTTMKDGTYLSHRLMDLYMPSIQTELTFQTFVSTVLLTFLIILVLWLFFRSSGSIYSLKEFYNIGSIASIVPLTAIFILSWVLPGLELFAYFSTIFGIYYLIMILLINKQSKIA